MNLILFYTKTNNPIWNEPFVPFSEDDKVRLYKKIDDQGLIEWSKNGVPRRKIFADEQKGKKLQDIWDFKDYQYPVYPTEKNLDLLKLIVQTSSNPESLVMDFFCGSGTTLVAAQELGRRWIGVDKSKKMIEVVRKKMTEENSTLFKFDFEFINILEKQEQNIHNENILSTKKVSKLLVTA